MLYTQLYYSTWLVFVSGATWGAVRVFHHVSKIGQHFELNQKSFILSLYYLCWTFWHLCILINSNKCRINGTYIGVCERPEKAMKRDPDGLLPQKQGLILTSQPTQPDLTLSFHNTTKAGLKSVSILTRILSKWRGCFDKSALQREDPLSEEHWLHKYCGLGER